jgi:hypothetical protein
VSESSNEPNGFDTIVEDAIELTFGVTTSGCCLHLLDGDSCYVSQTMRETNPNNLVISILDSGKGCYSLP